MTGVGGAWCVRCGCDIEGGGSGGQWEEKEEEEEEDTGLHRFRHHFLSWIQIS